MIKIKAKRVDDKDLLAFCNSIAMELGGGRDGLRFGIEKGKDGKETIWLFGKKLQVKED